MTYELALDLEGHGSPGAILDLIKDDPAVYSVKYDNGAAILFVRVLIPESIAALDVHIGTAGEVLPEN